MCELFGISAARRIPVNPYLKTLMSHSTEHPNGWGVAMFYGDAVSLEKEPKPAWTSDYLRSRLQHPFEAQNMIAHIRLATRGQMAYENCHPFVDRSCDGRAWTLVHNGTIFQSELLDGYRDVQEGSTDSERILCHIIHEADQLAAECGAPTAEQRFRMADRIIPQIAPHNKLNLLFYDGELLYVHTNMAHTLYRRTLDHAVLFATTPLDDSIWEPVPMMQLLAYRNGELVFEGTCHSSEYHRPDSLISNSGWAGL